MASSTIQAATLTIANLIADGQYASAIQACSGSRLTPEDIAGVIHDYGGTFVRLPPDFGDFLDVVAIEGRSPRAWSVRTPLWTLEEGRSDLTLELTVAVKGNESCVELDDLKVM